MIRLVETSAGGQPARWILAFQKSTESWWVRWLACGRYKHVSAFGYVADVDHWVFFDWRFRTIDFIVARGRYAEQLIEYYTRDADLLGMTPDKTGGAGLRLGFWCVPAIKQLLGLRCSALRPDALWADCVRQGADIISHESAGPAADSGPDAAATAAAGAE